MPIMGYHNGNADGPQVQAVFKKNPYIAGWWGKLGEVGEVDYNLDLLKDAAEVFEQQCSHGFKGIMILLQLEHVKLCPTS